MASFRCNLSFPATDERTREWLRAQKCPSDSMRYLIAAYVKAYGATDPMVTFPELRFGEADGRHAVVPAGTAAVEEPPAARPEGAAGPDPAKSSLLDMLEGRSQRPAPKGAKSGSDVVANLFG